MRRPPLVVFAVAAIASVGSAASAGNVNIALEDAHRVELNKGFAYLNAGQPAEAEPLFSRVAAAYERAYAGREVRCARNQQDAVFAGLLAMMGNPDEIARRASTMKPGESKVVRDRYQEVIVLGPGWCEAIFGRAFALIDLHRSDEAEPLLARVVEMAPTKAHYLNEYAELFKSRREWQRSYDLFARARDLATKGADADDKNVEARSLRGMGYNKIELGDLDEAERLFKLSLTLQPDNAGAMSELRFIAQRKAIAK